MRGGHPGEGFKSSREFEAALDSLDTGERPKVEADSLRLEFDWLTDRLHIAPGLYLKALRGPATPGYRVFEIRVGRRDALRAAFAEFDRYGNWWVHLWRKTKDNNAADVGRALDIAKGIHKELMAASWTPNAAQQTAATVPFGPSGRRNPRVNSSRRSSSGRSGRNSTGHGKRHI